MTRVPAHALDQTFARVLAAVSAAAPRRRSRRLDLLFADLRRPRPSRPAEDIVDLIWALWIDHPDEAAQGALMAAVAAMESGAYDLARPMFDRLVAEHPTWAEAWNKRAILAFVERRDADCLLDIERTLALEPRHFGALIGLGRVYLRQKRPLEAKAVFEAALAIHPHLPGVRARVAELEGERGPAH